MLDSSVKTHVQQKSNAHSRALAVRTREVYPTKALPQTLALVSSAEHAVAHFKRQSHGTARKHPTQHFRASDFDQTPP